MSKNTLLKSLHKNINQAVASGILDFLDEYQTQKMKGYFNKDKVLFKVDSIYSLKEINKDYGFLQQRLSHDLIPISKSENGDRIAIHFKSGQIFIWELSKDLLTDNSQRKETKIANSWIDFKAHVKDYFPEATEVKTAEKSKPSFFEKLFRAG